MARHSSFGARVAQYQREQERKQRAVEKERLRAAREAEKARKAYERARAAEEKERKRLYVEKRIAEVDAMNEKLEADVSSLNELLVSTLGIDDFIDFEDMKETVEVSPFQPGRLATPEPPPIIDTFMPSRPSPFARLLPWLSRKHERDVARAKETFAKEQEAHRAREAKRTEALAEAQRTHEEYEAEFQRLVDEHNREIDDFRARFAAGDPEAVVEYFSLVLEASRYPEGFPKNHKLAFVPESKQLVVEYEVPPATIVPAARQYKYVKARDDVQETSRPASQVRALYADVVAQTTLRTLHELFEADRGNQAETIVLNSYVSTIDPATGRAVAPHLVTVRASKHVFMQLELSQVDPLACLRGLSASVSKSPAELVPVRPILEFDMVDPRFVQESDVLGTLDPRPNLMDLSPKEFEGLITNLFGKMGLETRQTQASRDGGVDCVAFDPTPILGGKVVIQAKRYKNTVGVSAVRDLYGTMQNEGASKGILVSTSGYGKASFEFADGKPLELLSGSNLLFLLATHAAIEARIEPPDDWVDPLPDEM